MQDDNVFTRNLCWLIRLRWAGIIIALAAPIAGRRLGYISAPLGPLYGILLFPILFNLYFTLQERRGKAGRHESVLGQIFADQLTLAALFAVTGVCHSPLLFFFLFHVVVSGILLPYRFTLAVAANAALLPLVVVGLGHAGLLPSYDILAHAAAWPADWDTILTHGVAFLATLFLTTYFAVYLSRELQRSRERLADENRKLTALVSSSRTAGSLPERSRIATESFRAILRDRRAHAEIVLMEGPPAGSRCSDHVGCRESACPAYRTDAVCWKLSGTRCTSHVAFARSPGGDRGPDGADMPTACFHCGFFLATAAALLSAPHPAGRPVAQRERENDVRRALRNGLDILRHGAAGPVPAARAAFPLVMHGSLAGLLHLSSSRATISGDLAEFIALFSELTSSGLVGSRMIDAVESSYLQTVEALANAIEAKDPYTRGHSRRVSQYSLAIADALGLSRQEKEHLSFAAVLHDVGKIGVRRELLVKTEHLTGRERDDMRTHPEIGARILGPVDFLKPALMAIRHHHEQYDGSGYPAGLRGDDIPFKARIINVADAWDAMTTDRAYRKALSPEDAIGELVRCAGKQFDREIVEVFVRSLASGQRGVRGARSGAPWRGARDEGSGRITEHYGGGGLPDLRREEQRRWQ